MTHSNPVAEEIKRIIQKLMDNVMNKVLIEDPFIIEEHRVKKPLYAALVPDEIFKGSHFERRFVTPFGGVWEKLAYVAANNPKRNVELQKSIEGLIPENRLKRIQQVLNELEHTQKDKMRRRPNWEKEVEYINQEGGELIPCTVISDLYVEDTITSKKYAFELKAPLPNSDQTKVSKEKILKLFCMQPKLIDDAFFVLPYNPYKTKENYSWSFPKRWFDMTNDKVVMIGEEFWDFLGGIGTYQMFVRELNNIGAEYKERIYNEYLGIIPPAHSTDFKL